MYLLFSEWEDSMSKFLKVLGVVILVTSCIATILSLPILDLSILLSGLLGFGLLFAAGEVLDTLHAIERSIRPVKEELPGIEKQNNHSEQRPQLPEQLDTNERTPIAKKCANCGKRYALDVARCDKCNMSMWTYIFNDQEK